MIDAIKYPMQCRNAPPFRPPCFSAPALAFGEKLCYNENNFSDMLGCRKEYVYALYAHYHQCYR